jgi:hypothetical protein
MSVVRNHVPKIYKDIKNELFAQLAEKPIIGALVTDGWRKKAAQQGVPLINAMVTPPDGGALFWKVRVICRQLLWTSCSISNSLLHLKSVVKCKCANIRHYSCRPKQQLVSPRMSLGLLSYTSHCCSS